MWRNLLLAIPALLGFLFAGCGLLQPPLEGSGAAVTETVEVEAFERLNIAGGATVAWQAGERASVTVTVDENLLPHLVRQSSNGRLDVHFDRNVQTRTAMKVIITTPRLTEITLVGGGLMALENLDQSSLRVELVGGGGFSASGTCEQLDVVVIGSGTVGTERLIAQDVTVQITGSGAVDVHADRTCEVTIIGSGDVLVAGNAEPTQEIVGSGTVRRAKSDAASDETGTVTGVGAIPTELDSGSAEKAASQPNSETAPPAEDSANSDDPHRESSELPAGSEKPL